MKTSQAIDDLFTYQLHVLKKQTDRVMNEAFSEALALTLPEARILINVGAKGPRSVSELGKASYLDRSRASRATDGLEERGLVTKEASAVDARGVVVHLTTKGQAAFRRAIQIAHAKNAEILSPLTPEEEATLASVFAKLIVSQTGPD